MHERSSAQEGFGGLSQNLKCLSYCLLGSWVLRSACSGGRNPWRKTTVLMNFSVNHSTSEHTEPITKSHTRQGPPLGPTTSSAPLQSPFSVLKGCWVPTGLLSQKAVLFQRAFRLALGTEQICPHTFSGRRNWDLTVFLFLLFFIYNLQSLAPNEYRSIYNCITFMRCVSVLIISYMPKHILEAGQNNI